MAPKRRTGDVLLGGAPNQMHAPSDQRAEGSPQALALLSGIDVGLPLTNTGSSRAAWPRDYATGSKLAGAHATGYATTTQSETNTTHGVHTHADEGQRNRKQNTTETQPGDHSTCDIPTRGAIYPIQGKARQRGGANQRVHGSVPANWERPIHSLQHGQPFGPGLSAFGSAPADWGMPRGPRRRHYSTDSPCQQCRRRHARSDAHSATPRRSIGGRCRKWAVSTQDSSSTNKRACAACTLCGKQSTYGEPKLQQRGNRVVETDFGQSDFGHRYPTDFGQSDFGQSDFGQTDFGQTDFGQTDFGQR